MIVEDLPSSCRDFLDDHGLEQVRRWLLTRGSTAV